MNRLSTAGTLLVVLICVSGASAQDVIGEPLNGRKSFTLGDDLGFGKEYSPSLSANFQDWGATAVSAAEGFPVRLGGRSIRFETREGFCGVDPGYWSDCENGRSRHELSTAGDFDPWDADVWYALSLYIPDGYDAPSNIKTSIFQYWAGGSVNWMFKYEKDRGFFVQRKFDNTDTVVVPESEVVNHWVDYVVRIRHSPGSDGALTLWANGEQVYTYTGRTGGDNRNLRPYFKFGIYNTAMGPDRAPIDGGGYGNGEGLPNLSLYFDEVRFGSKCADLKLGDFGYDCAAFTDEGADKAVVAELQQALNALGCDVGPADGVIGPRTRAAALSCRYFEPGILPDALTVATLPTFITLYAADRAVDLPTQPPSDAVAIASVNSDLVGPNKDVALYVHARAEGIDLNFIVIGQLDESGRTLWLDLLLRDDLGQPIPETVTRCSRVRTESWNDGSTHAVIKFDQAGASFRAAGGDCIVAGLPPETAKEADYLLTRFRNVAVAITGTAKDSIHHAGARAFVENVAASEVTIGK